MDNQPNWLNITEYIYPTTLMKKILLKNDQHGVYEEVVVHYNSQKRQIDLTDALSELIHSMYSFETNLYVSYYDHTIDKFVMAGEYPFEECFVLGEEYLEVEVIIIKVDMFNKERSKERTIKQVVEKVAHWRRVHLQSDKKISLEESARIIGIPKRTLDDYFLQLKLGEKYDFNFEENLEEGVGMLRKFVRQNHQKKKNQPLLKILEKYRNK